MRPRVFPAEDLLDAGGDFFQINSPASMRPRVFPAEDPSRFRAVPSRFKSFNEAAGIPRGRPSRSIPTNDRSSCFNEAAGIPRGRPSSRHSLPPRRLAASMRPRVFPAEDRTQRRRSVRPARRASMRPRVFPAEDQTAHDARERQQGASMRPRVFPAEDRVIDFGAAAGAPASMRPRVFPAEDRASGRAPVRGARLASMRPRVFPAEDPGGHWMRVTEAEALQ